MFVVASFFVEAVSVPQRELCALFTLMRMNSMVL